MAANSYFVKHSFYSKQIQDVPDNNLGIVIVIPCYNEPDLISALEAIWKCERPACSVEVIVVVNSSEKEKEEVLNQNALTVKLSSGWIKEHDDPRLKFYIIEASDLPGKHAGVGLTRKIGMDEAALRLDTVLNKNGVIVCFDADCTCDSDYLIEIENHFKKHLLASGCSIYYEHPISGNRFDKDIYEGILNYELFLRYYNQALRYSGFPFAYHTVGSSMAVRNEAYQKQGGMNKRKAGEDFYFLQKIIPSGNYTELNTTRVIPSPRSSNRVPFGTGTAIQKWLDNKNKEFITYHPQTFADLKGLFLKLPGLYTSISVKPFLDGFSEPVINFLVLNDFEKKINEIKSNSSSEAMFRKRFFGWFNSFVALKYVHFVRDNYYPQMEIGLAAKNLLSMINEVSLKDLDSNQSLLLKYREIERGINI